MSAVERYLDSRFSFGNTHHSTSALTPRVARTVTQVEKAESAHTVREYDRITVARSLLASSNLVHTQQRWGLATAWCIVAADDPKAFSLPDPSLTDSTAR